VISKLVAPFPVVVFISLVLGIVLFEVKSLDHIFSFNDNKKPSLLLVDSTNSEASIHLLQSHLADHLVHWSLFRSDRLGDLRPIEHHFYPPGSEAVTYISLDSLEPGTSYQINAMVKVKGRSVLEAMSLNFSTIARNNPLNSKPCNEIEAAGCYQAFISNVRADNQGLFQSIPGMDAVLEWEYFSSSRLSGIDKLVYYGPIKNSRPHGVGRLAGFKNGKKVCAVGNTFESSKNKSCHCGNVEFSNGNLLGGNCKFSFSGDSSIDDVIYDLTFESLSKPSMVNLHYFTIGHFNISPVFGKTEHLEDESDFASFIPDLSIEGEAGTWAIFNPFQFTFGSQNEYGLGHVEPSLVGMIQSDGEYVLIDKSRSVIEPRGDSNECSASSQPSTILDVNGVWESFYSQGQSVLFNKELDLSISLRKRADQNPVINVSNERWSKKLNNLELDGQTFTFNSVDPALNFTESARFISSICRSKESIIKDPQTNERSITGNACRFINQLIVRAYHCEPG